MKNTLTNSPDTLAEIDNPHSTPESRARAPLISSFGVLLSELDGGDVQSEASEKLAELVQRVSQEFKGGSLTLKINVKPGGAKRALALTATVTAKMPEAEKEATLLFATEDGLLTKQNPDQKELPLRVIDQPDRSAPKTV